MSDSILNLCGKASKFPGPIPAKLTKLYYPWVYKKYAGKYYLAQREWLEEYGDVVRTGLSPLELARSRFEVLLTHPGPNEIVTNRPEVIPYLSKALKGTWYNIGASNPSLQLTRNIETHRIRRKAWDRGFSPAAVELYIPRIKPYTTLLTEALARNREVNITEWIGYYMCDTMGELTYGQGFGMVEKGGQEGTDYFIRSIHDFMKVVGPLGHVPWTLLLLQKIGAAGKKHALFVKWCKELVEKRQQRGMTGGKKDIFEHLLEAEPENKKPNNIPLHGDSRTAVIAGR